MGNENTVSFRMQVAIEQAQQAMATFQQEFNKSVGTVQKGSQTAAAALGALNGSAGMVASTLGMAFGPAALLLMGRAATDNIRQIELLSEIMGSTVPAASGMAKSLRSAGGDLGSLESAAMHASAQLQAAKNGSADATRAFYNLGIIPEKIQTLPELFQKVADFMHNDARPEAEKLALVHQVLGRSVRDLIPWLNEGGTAMMRFSGTIDDRAVEQARKFDAQLKQLQDNIRLGIGLPVISFINQHEEMTQWVADFSIAWLLAPKLLNVIQQIANIAPSMGANLGTMFGGLKALLGGAPLSALPWMGKVGAVGGVAAAGVAAGYVGGSLVDDWRAKQITDQSEADLKQQAARTMALTDQYTGVRIRASDELESLATEEAATYRKELQGAMLYEQAFIMLGKGTAQEVQFAHDRIKALGDALNAFKISRGEIAPAGYEIPGGGGARGAYEDMQKARDLQLKAQADADSVRLAELKDNFERSKTVVSVGTAGEGAGEMNARVQQRLSLQEYLDGRLKLITDAYRREHDAAKADLDRAKTEATAAKGHPDEVPKLMQTMSAMSKVAAVEKKNDADLLALDQERYKLQLAEQKQQDESRIALEEAAGQKLNAGRQKIEEQYQEKLRAAPAGDMAYADRLAKTRDLQLANAGETDSLKKQTEAEQTYNAELLKTANELQAGAITQTQSRARDIESAQTYLSVLSATIPALEAARKKIRDLGGDTTDLDIKLKQLGATFVKVQQDARKMSVIGEIEFKVRELSAQWTDMGRQISDAITTSMSEVSSSVGRTISDAMWRTGNWRQSMQQLAQTITQTFSTMVTQYVAAKLAMMAADSVASKASQADSAATTAAAVPAGIAQAGAQGGIWGVLAYAGVFVAVMAAVMAAVAAASGGFAEGGIIAGPGSGTSDSILARVSNGEAVLPARVVAQNPELIQRMISGAVDLNNMASQIPSAIASPISGSAAYAAAGGGFNGNVHVAPAPVQVAVLNSPAHVRAFLESAAGRKVLFDTVRSQKLDLGLKS